MIKSIKLNTSDDSLARYDASLHFDGANCAALSFPLTVALALWRQKGDPTVEGK